MLGFTMSYFKDLKDRELVDAIVASDKLAAEGQMHDAFILINKNIMKNFTRMGFIQALMFMFQIVDECNLNTRIFLKNEFIKTAYEDVNRLTCLLKNKPQVHFWAGCLKLCQYRNESQLSLLPKMEALMKAREHFKFTLEHKPNHIMAPFLLTVCDNAYFDLSGTVPYPEITSRKPEEFYKRAMDELPEYFLPFAFILGKLTFYIREHYLAECYLNMCLCCPPKTPLEDHLSQDSFLLLNKIAELKNVQFY